MRVGGGAVRRIGARELGRGLLDAVVGAIHGDEKRFAPCRKVAGCGTGRASRLIGARTGAGTGTGAVGIKTRLVALLLDHALREFEQRARLRGGPVEHLLRIAPALLEVVAVLLEPAGAEQRAKKRLALIAGREQKARELVLREQDHLLELLRAEPEHVAERDADIARLRGATHPHPVDPLFEHRARRLGGEPAPALGRAVVFGGPRHAPAGVADRELEPHLGRVGERTVVAAQPLLPAVVARHAAVEGEAHPVEDARLACAGAARDEEHPVVAEGIEVDPLRLAEGAEPRQFERVQSHASASARTRSSSTSRRMSASTSLAPSPARTCPRKASTSSVSLRAARTRCTYVRPSPSRTVAGA